MQLLLGFRVSNVVALLRTILLVAAVLVVDFDGRIILAASDSHLFFIYFV
jgi:hypothetical protein